MDINKILKELKQELEIVLDAKYKELKPELESEINEFLEDSKEKLERWLFLLNSSAISPEEFEWLLKSQQNLLTLQTLQTAGISKIKLNALKNTIFKVIFQTVLKVLVISL
ncbi:hypothetical protein ABGT15_04705 [Flavobacterium enshiense]|uniref:hypothetical protein n=1 Tax=Flavobacterium enshiense TaxID=1341165 RepID=UPI00345D4827